MNWWKDSKVKIESEVRLSEHTTFRIGGPAKFFCQPKDLHELKLLINVAKQYKIKFLVIGAGSNILASDKGVRALVVRLNAPDFKRVSARGDIVTAGAGSPLGKILELCARRGLSGLEFLAGIPGTLGGCLAMNAGAWGESISKRLVSCLVMDKRGRLKTLKNTSIKFGYRFSSLADYIILEAAFRLPRATQGQIRQKIKKNFLARKAAQDLARPSAGCVFKNPAGDSAGRLIDACGLKGRKAGRAAISSRHANFIVNCGRAKSSDVVKLMGLIKKSVKRKFDITLEPEIKIWQ